MARGSHRLGTGVGLAGAIVLIGSLGAGRSMAQGTVPPRSVVTPLVIPYLPGFPNELYLYQYSNMLIPRPPVTLVRPQPVVRPAPPLTSPIHDVDQSASDLDDLRDGQWHSTNSRGFWSRFSWSDLRGWTFVRHDDRRGWFYARMIPGTEDWTFARRMSDGTWIYAIPESRGRWTYVRLRAERWSLASGAGSDWRPLTARGGATLPQGVRRWLKSAWLDPTKGDQKPDQSIVRAYLDPPSPPAPLLAFASVAALPHAARSRRAE